MRSLSFILGACALSFAAVPAQAAVCESFQSEAMTVDQGSIGANLQCFLPGDAEFTTTGGTTGDISASFSRDGIAAGTFTDLFQFIVDADGVGSGSLATSASTFSSVLNLDFTSVFVNGMMADILRSPNGLVEFASITGVPIQLGVLNTIQVNGFSRGNGSFGGQATFEEVPAVPEPSTWAMMLLGFGVIGFALRRRRNTRLEPQFA